MNERRKRRGKLEEAWEEKGGEKGRSDRERRKQDARLRKRTVCESGEKENKTKEEKGSENGKKCKGRRWG
jgi:hypothetical protein